PKAMIARVSCVSRRPNAVPKWAVGRPKRRSVSWVCVLRMRNVVEEDSLLGQHFRFSIFDLRFRLREGRGLSPGRAGFRPYRRTGRTKPMSQCLLGFCEVRGPYGGAYRRTGRSKERG